MDPTVSPIESVPLTVAAGLPGISPGLLPLFSPPAPMLSLPRPHRTAFYSSQSRSVLCCTGCSFFPGQPPRILRTEPTCLASRTLTPSPQVGPHSFYERPRDIRWHPVLPPAAGIS